MFASYTALSVVFMHGCADQMDLRALRYFRAVAELASINKAAAQLGISQPALSRQIRLLEKDLGRQLLLRHGRGVLLTEAGMKLLGIATDVLRRLEEARVCLRDTEAQSTERRALVIGIAGAPATLLSSPIMERFAPSHPELGLEFKTAPNETLKRQLIDGELDVAVLSNAQPDDLLVLVPLVVETVKLIKLQPPAGRAAGKPQIAEYVGLPILTTAFVRQLCERDLARMYSEAGLPPPLLTIADSMTVVHAILSQGQCFYLGPSTSLTTMSQQRFREKLIPGAHISRAIALPNKRPLSHSTLELVEFIEATARQLIKNGRWSGAWPAAQVG